VYRVSPILRCSDHRSTVTGGDLLMGPFSPATPSNGTHRQLSNRLRSVAKLGFGSVL
jgi:hypothetical protein